MGHSSVFVSDSVAVEDDHMPFLRVGVPAVDLVDLDYTDWHRDSDTLDKLSPRSMEIVGRVVLRALPEIESRLAGAPKP
jgi:hypothetical protein